METFIKEWVDLSMQSYLDIDRRIRQRLEAAVTASAAHSESVQYDIQVFIIMIHAVLK